MKAIQAIYNRLNSDSALTTLLADRIYPVVAPQQTALPYMVITVVSNQPTPIKNGTSPADGIRVQIDTFASTYASASDVDNAARQSLDKNAFTMDGQVIDGIKYENTVQMIEEDAEVHHFATDYIVRWKRTIST